MNSSDVVKDSDELFAKTQTKVQEIARQVAVDSGGRDSALVGVRLDDLATLLTAVSVYQAKNELNLRVRDKVLDLVQGHTGACDLKHPRVSSYATCNCAWGAIRRCYGVEA